MSFDKWKKSSGKSLQEKVAQLKQEEGSGGEEGFLKIGVGKDKTSSAIVRFLPPKGDGMPIIRQFQHFIQKGDKYFTSLCPTMRGDDCVSCNKAKEFYAVENKDEGGKWWKKKRYIANVYVVEDENEPKNNGKVFLYAFGIKIYEKVMAAFAPEDKDMEAKEIFDIFEGYDFKIKVSEAGTRFANYDQSFFLSKPSALAGGDEKKMEEVFESMVELETLISEEKIPTGEEFAKRFNSFLKGSDATAGKSVESEASEPRKAGQTKKKEEKKADVNIDMDDDDDSLSDLLNGDDDDDDIPF